MSGLGIRLTSSNAAWCSAAVFRFKSRPRASRSIHKLRLPPYPVEGGLGDFLPPQALQVVAIDYPEGLLKRLNEEVCGSPEADENIAQTVLNTASSKEKTLAFNYASLALNNSYFLDQLRPPPTEGGWKNHQHKMTLNMRTSIQEHYGTLLQLKSAFSSAVMGMFTSGWVWFVSDRSGRLGIIPTFGPGTLLIRSRSYMSSTSIDLGTTSTDVGITSTDTGSMSTDLGSTSTDLGPPFGQLDTTVPFVHAGFDARNFGATEEEMNADLDDDIQPLRSPAGSPTSPTLPSPSSPVSGVSGGKQPPASPNALHPRFRYSTRTRTGNYPPKDSLYRSFDTTKSPRPTPQTKTEAIHLGETLYPLFCISVHEHAWMAAGYGVWGKEAWLKQFWTVLDWEKVSQAYERVHKPPIC